MANLALKLVQPKNDSPFAHDVIEGLTKQRKHLPPKYFYDEAGSKLFERITEQPEYYPTRCELEILENQAAEISTLFPIGAALVEFGSGSSTKARILLKAASTLSAYVPIDISEEHLRADAANVMRDFPRLDVIPIVADFAQPLELPENVQSRPCVGFFPGSTIGNFEPHEACAFLQRAGKILGPGGLLLVGVDLTKDQRILNAAYNDKAGVTKAFNLNLLTRMNRELGASFKLPCFEHHAFFNRELSRIEMHLAAIKKHKVRIGSEVIDFRAGETIHTENSYKYSIEMFGALARGAGWKPLKVWTDRARYFSIHALTPQGDRPARAA